MSDPVDAGGAQLRFQVFESTGDMLYRVMEEKFCEQYGLECRGVRIGAGPAGIQALLGESLEVSFITTDAAIRAINGGAPVRIVHGIGDRVPFYLVARRGLERPNAGEGFPAIMQDFEGKRIGVTGRGAGTELIGRLLLREAGMSEDDVTFVAVGGPPTAYGSLAANQIDAAVMVPPLAEICDRSDVCETVLNLPTEDGIESINALDGTGIVALMSQDYIEKNPEVVKAFLAAVQDAGTWMQDPANFGEYYAIAQENITLRIPHADEILREALQRQLQISDVQVRPAAVEAYIDMLYDMGLITEKRPVDQIISDKALTP
ncbi:ABC transporter substrate-binding protein [Halomonas ramblicola]|uniref:ABC transporter substrate-binding protein n=1 Tax=Halomonas ramblicola TaxID=747349 RepID=UPI0025B3CB23|nr:ABC transporter substrate-binding protein [Halomonas ramblicola]MDN3521999.1 ABC transporter substrate-binding protein [Halomonas ramblicola]